MTWVAIGTTAVTIGAKVISDVKAKKEAKKADQQAAQERIDNERKSNRSVIQAQQTARQSDPGEAARQRQIQEVGASTIGRAVASSGSTQEIINAAQQTQATTNRAQLASSVQASQIKLGLRQQLASRFSESGRLRLAGEGLIDQRLQGAVDAIGANAQANVDSAQNIGGQVFDIAALLRAQKKQATPVV